MNPGTANKAYIGTMAEHRNSPQNNVSYGQPGMGIPSYVHDNYEASRSPAQLNENYNNYGFNGLTQMKPENYIGSGPGDGARIHSEVFNSVENSKQISHPFENMDRPSAQTPNYVRQETPTIKSEPYVGCENPVVKNETYTPHEMLPMKTEPYWSNSSASSSHDGYGFTSPQTFGGSVNRDYTGSMSQDYLGPTSNMVGSPSSQSYSKMTSVKTEIDPSQIQTTMSVPSAMYPQISSPIMKAYEPNNVSLSSPGYQSPVSQNNGMYEAGAMSSHNPLYNQQMSSHNPYQSNMSSHYPSPTYPSSHGPMYPDPNMSSIYQHLMTSPNTNYTYQQYPVYNNSNPYHQAPSSSSYPHYVPQAPWTNFNTGFPPGEDNYSDSVVNCSPKKKSKLTHSKKEPVQIVSQQHFHSKRGIYLFQMREMNSATPNFSIADNLLMIEKQLCENLIQIDLPDNVCYVYNPLEYAFNPHRNYTEKFCNTQKQILFLGMNPGPFGMSQNGVPFGEYNIVRDWLKITGDVSKPLKEHPKRIIVGLDCKRSEVTGSRFWGYFRRLCGTPENFFRHCFVYNICPMAFMSDTGKNITPPQIPSHILKSINNVCNNSLIEVIQLLNVKTVIGVGNYAYNSAQKLLSSANMEHIKVHVIMHPSPINPAANKGWDNIARDQLKTIGILDLLQSGNPENNHDLS